MMLLLLLPQWVRGTRWEKDSTMKVSRFSEVCMGFYRMIYKTKIFNEYFVVVVVAVVFIHYSPSVSFCKCTIVNMHSCRVYFAGAVIHFEDAECSLRVYAQLNSCALSSSWSVRLSLGFISHTIFHTIHTHLLRTQTHNTANMHLPTLWRTEIQSDAVCSCWCHCFPTLSSHNYQVYIWMHSTEGIRLYLSPFPPSPAWLFVHRTSLTMRWWCGIWISMLMMAVAVENFVIISCVSCVVWSKLFAQIDGDSS